MDRATTVKGAARPAEQDAKSAEQNASQAEQDFVHQLELDYPEVKFVWGRPRFSYRLKNGVPTVFLGEPQPNFGLLALHELGHALCGHKDYKVDVQRIKIESEAWERAKTVYGDYVKRLQKNEAAAGGNLSDNEIGDGGQSLSVILPEWDEDFVQEKLDTYRDWLHAKSRCKKCGLTRYQTENGEYHCPRCENFARS